ISFVSVGARTTTTDEAAVRRARRPGVRKGRHKCLGVRVAAAAVYRCSASGRRGAEPGTPGANRLQPLVSSLGDALATNVSDESELAEARAAHEAAEATLAEYVEALAGEDVSPQSFAAVVKRLEQKVRRCARSRGRTLDR